MRDIVTATLSGNLTRDVELRALPSGSDVARLRIASTTHRRTGEAWVEKTNYFTVEVCGAQARSCEQYLRKSSRVVVDDELDWREWTDPDDKKRAAVTFRARNAVPTTCRSDPRSPMTKGAADLVPAALPAPANRPPGGRIAVGVNSSYPFFGVVVDPAREIGTRHAMTSPPCDGATSLRALCRPSSTACRVTTDSRPARPTP